MNIYKHLDDLIVFVPTRDFYIMGKLKMKLYVNHLLIEISDEKCIYIEFEYNLNSFLHKLCGNDFDTIYAFDNWKKFKRIIAMLNGV